MGKIVGRFEFRGDIGAAAVEVMLDSGASVSVIRRDVARKLAAHPTGLEPRTLRMVNGEEWLQTAEGVLLQVGMKGKMLDGRFYVVEEMPREAIIGVDFLQCWKIRLDLKNHDFTVGLDPGAIEMA